MLLLLPVAASAWYFLFRRANPPSGQHRIADSPGRADPTGKLHLVDGADKLAMLVTPRTKSRQAAPMESLDAVQDGWQTENLADEVKSRLNRVATLLTQPDRIVPAALADMVADDSSCSPLWPAKMTKAFRDHAIEVRRGDDPPPATAGKPSRGPAGTFQDTAALPRTGRIRYVAGTRSTRTVTSSLMAAAIPAQMDQGDYRSGGHTPTRPWHHSRHTPQGRLQWVGVEFASGTGPRL